MATGAQADELTALKAQLELLQSRVQSLETQPAPTLPPGAKLITVRRGQGTYAEILPMRASEQLRDHQGYTIAVTPTADMPAPVSEVTVSGEIRARLLYVDEDIESAGTFIDLDADDVSDVGESSGFDTNFFDVTTRGRLRIDGKTETAIGEVGGTIRLQGTDGDAADMNIIWGYWQMTPNLQLGAGYTDSLAAIQASVDWNGNAVLNGFNAGPTNQSVSSFRLTYSNGGLTLAAALEDNDVGDMPAFAGYVGFDTGSFLINASALWQDDDSTAGTGGVAFNDTDDDWVVGVGVIGHLGDMLRIEAAANKGEGYDAAVYGLQNVNENDYEFWSASLLAVLSFASNMSLELDFGYTDLDHESDETYATSVLDQVEKLWSVGGALYWDPVDQLTLGWGIGWNKQEDDDTEYDNITAGFGAWFRF
jgi:hypothetical protein